MENPQTLQNGTVLAGEYIIEDVLGAGGFGITYSAAETALNRKVAIKEYFPCDFAQREGGRKITPKTLEWRRDYVWGLERFIEEAQTLAKFNHDNIVRVFRVFRENNSAYIVLHLEEGLDFGSWLNTLGVAPGQQEIDAIASPLLNALEVIHQSNFLHRDIAPDNIIIRKDGTPVLIDFGSARPELTHGNKTVSALVKPGYSPYEQYAVTSQDQGPWTDIYSLGGTLYQAVTGMRPPDAPTRMVRDDLAPAAQCAQGRYRQNFLSAIDHALRMAIEDRPQSVKEWRAHFAGRKDIISKQEAQAQAVPLQHNLPLPQDISEPLILSPADALPEIALPQNNEPGNEQSHDAVNGLQNGSHDVGPNGGDSLNHRVEHNGADLPDEEMALNGSDPLNNVSPNGAEPSSEHSSNAYPSLVYPQNSSSQNEKAERDPGFSEKAQDHHTTDGQARSNNAGNPGSSSNNVEIQAVPAVAAVAGLGAVAHDYAREQEQFLPPEMLTQDAASHDAASQDAASHEDADDEDQREHDLSEGHDAQVVPATEAAIDYNKTAKIEDTDTPPAVNLDLVAMRKQSKSKQSETNDKPLDAEALEKESISAQQEGGDAAQPSSKAVIENKDEPLMLGHKEETRAMQQRRRARPRGLVSALSQMMKGERDGNDGDDDPTPPSGPTGGRAKSNGAASPNKDDEKGADFARLEKQRKAEQALADKLAKAERAKAKKEARQKLKQEKAKKAELALEKKARKREEKEKRKADILASKEQAAAAKAAKKRYSLSGRQGAVSLAIQFVIAVGFASAIVYIQGGVPNLPGNPLGFSSKASTSPQLLRTFAGHRGDVSSIAFSQDGKTIISGSYDRTIKLWSSKSGTLLRSIDAQEEGIYAIAVSRSRIASADAGGKVKLWDADTGEKISATKSHLGLIWAVTFAGDDNRIISAGQDRTLKLWNSATSNAPEYAFRGHSNAVHAVAFSPKGNYFASGGADKTLKLWNMRTRRLVRTYRGHRDYIGAIAIAPNGRMIASGSYDKTIKIWASHKRRVLRTLRGHKGRVIAVAFSPDGRYLASGSEDKTIKIWDTRRGKLLYSYQGHYGAVSSVAFSPNGRQIISSSTDQTIKLWSVPIEVAATS